MSIEKDAPSTLKHIGSGFTTIINETMDLIPDATALGIYVYLLRKPEDWVIREKDIQNRFGIGRDLVRAKLGILYDVGVYQKISIRGETGKIIRWETNLFKTPRIMNQHQITENQESGKNQITEKPECGLSHMWLDPTHTKERLITKERSITNSCSSDDELNSEEECFNRFWEAYPRKEAKQDAMKAWKKIKQKDYEQIISDVILRKNKNWKGKSKQYIPLPASYLNGQRWNDELTIQQEQSNGRRENASEKCARILTDDLRKSYQQQDETAATAVNLFLS